MAFLFWTVLSLVHPSAGEVREWMGHSGDNANWSRAANWNPPGAPQNGDILVFHFVEGPMQFMETYNDLVDLQVGRVFYCGGSFGVEPTWTINGNQLTLLGSVVSTNKPPSYCSGSSFIFNCPLKIGAPLAIEMYSGLMILRGNIDLNGHDLTFVSGDRIMVSGQITGAGNVRVRVGNNFGESSVKFDGPMGNTFRGVMVANNPHSNVGRIIFDKQSGVVVTDSLMLGDDGICRLARSHQIGDNASVTVADGGQLLLDGHTETIGSLSLSNSARDHAPSLVDTGGSTLSVLGNITAVNNATGVVPIIRGKLGLPGGAADSKAKNTLTTPSRAVRTVSDVPLQSATTRATATNRPDANQQTLQGR